MGVFLPAPTWTDTLATLDGVGICGPRRKHAPGAHRRGAHHDRPSCRYEPEGVPPLARNYPSFVTVAAFPDMRGGNGVTGTVSADGSASSGGRSGRGALLEQGRLSLVPRGRRS